MEEEGRGAEKEEGRISASGLGGEGREGGERAASALLDVQAPPWSLTLIFTSGLALQNGRIKGDAKKALRAVIEKYNIPVTITANQNLILQELEPAWKADVLATLAAGGIKDVSEWDKIER